MTAHNWYKCVKCGDEYTHKCRCQCGGFTVKIEENKQVHPIFRDILKQFERREDGTVLDGME